MATLWAAETGCPSSSAPPQAQVATDQNGLASIVPSAENVARATVSSQ